jgi:hypothetical protein
VTHHLFGGLSAHLPPPNSAPAATPESPPATLIAKTPKLMQVLRAADDSTSKIIGE